MCVCGMPERNVQQKPKICDIIPKHNTMKYIISADLWLTARIGQQPHLLKKQQTPGACHMVAHTHMQAARQAGRVTRAEATIATGVW